MITLQEACEIAKKMYGITPTSGIRLCDNCRDVGVAWIFEWCPVEDPKMLYPKRGARVEKEDGATSWSYLPEDLDIIMNSVAVDISEYV